MVKCIIFSVALLLLNGCVPQYADPRYANVAIKPYQISNNKMSMVVAKISIPYTDLFNKPNHYNGYLRLVNIESKGKKKVYRIEGRSYLDSATMIIPGTYYIDSIQWSDGLYLYKIKVPLKPFDVKPGQCIYMGDISIVSSKNQDKILVKNNVSHAILGIQNSQLDSLAKKLRFFSPAHDITIKKQYHNAWDNY